MPSPLFAAWRLLLQRLDGLVPLLTTPYRAPELPSSMVFDKWTLVVVDWRIPRSVGGWVGRSDLHGSPSSTPL
jgi:hypothetical protein